ncbi:MAG TPA: MOSC domain-containing protein, partial [Rhodanobacteraceae bacterium]
DEVCVGDRYRIGSAIFEVSQPRVTCYRVGVRMGRPDMAALLVAHHRPGFYMRVIQEGEVGAGDAIVKVAEGPEHMTVAEADALVYLQSRYPDQEKLARALRIEAFSPGWKTTLRAMAERAAGTGWQENSGIILNSGGTPAWAGFRKLRVAARQQETDQVIVLDLVDAAGSDVGATAGQFVTLRLPGPNASAPLIRSYSLLDTARAGHYPIAVKCAPSGAAGPYVREHIHVGDTVDVAAPRGGFGLRSGSQAVVLLSAGIGVTPVLAMLRSLAESHATRPVFWIHCARNSTEHAFGRDANRLLQRLPDAHRLVVYSQPLETDRSGADFDLAGRLTAKRLLGLGVPASADVYLCGPETFMSDMRAALAAVPVPPAHVRTERYGTQASMMPGVVPQPATHSPHVPAGAPGTGPLVSFARSGVAVHWDDRCGSLLELAEACDVPVRWACRTGVCHTCISRVLSGSVRYSTEPLDRPDAGSALICCARPENDVTIDI